MCSINALLAMAIKETENLNNGEFFCFEIFSRDMNRTEYQEAIDYYLEHCF